MKTQTFAQAQRRYDAMEPPEYYEIDPPDELPASRTSIGNLDVLARWDKWRTPNQTTMIDAVLLNRIFEGWVAQDEAQDERNIRTWRLDLNR